MEIGRIFWLTILCLASSAASDRDDRHWLNNDETLPSQVGVPRRGIDESKIGCSRYCIQRKNISALEEGIVDSIKRVNIVWKIVNDSRVTFTGESSWGMSEDKELRWEPSRITLESEASFNDDAARCELYLQLGCGDHGKANGPRGIFDEHFNRELKNLASLDATEGYTETAFEVEDLTEELRIHASGKLSQAILEIPLAPRGHSTDARGQRPTLSLSRTSDAKGVRLDARNPPSGEWRLKLLGTGNSNYSLSVLADVEKIILTNSSEKRDVKSSISEPKESTENIVREVESIESSVSKEIAAIVEPSRTSETRSVEKFARQANLEEVTMKLEEIGKIVDGGSSGVAVEDESAKIVENSELEELARGVEDGRTGARKTVVDVHPSAELVARPGTFHVVVFTVKNNQALGIRHAFQGRSTRFRVISVTPSVLWIQPGEEVNVAVQIAVPNSQDAVASTVTLYVGGSENFEVVEKSTYIYVQGPGVTTTDNAKPSIDYSFNDNCAGKLGRERCARSRWSAEIIVKDSDSGLKRVVSLPEGVEPRTQFVAGTKNSVNFYYISSCCYTTVDVTAIDVQGNTYKRTIDVTEWDNLSQGEIAAVIVGALLILLLIILIVLIVVYCIRKRKSHDLSYSQRYGSRTPASAERTDF